MNYDIIGDIHGHADELEKLLQKLGYHLSEGIYSHSEARKVIFLGDYIDRGPKIRETLHIVKNMCDNGNAEAIMGNHEYNAVCFDTKDTKNGGFYRKHSFVEIHQHYNTLKQFKDFTDEWKIFLNWFRELPLFIEKENFRAVHACWDDKHINWIKQNYIGKLTNDFMALAADKRTNEYVVIEETLKGKEVTVPTEGHFHDKDGTLRKRSRIKWWKPENGRRLNKDVMFCSPGFGNKEFTVENIFIYNSEIPVFFGHYWLVEEPIIEMDQMAICLDYSVAKEGKLVGYRSEYLNELSKNKGFVY